MNASGSADDLVARIGRDGFALVPGVVGQRVVAQFASALDRAPRTAATLERAGRVYAMRDLLGNIPEVRALAASAAVRALVEPVLGMQAFVVRGLLFDKNPEANWVVPWHQDLTIAVREKRDVPGFGPWTKKVGIPHVRPPVEVLEQMLTLRVHLDDCDAASGPLRVLPGSHTMGILGDGAARTWLARGPAVECLAERGDVLVMRPLLLHASSTAERPRRRRVLHLEFAAGPLPGGIEWYESTENAKAAV
ncbi:MAG TPA: phytanoyl-CoA dioxygenase family protein [Isosphaeraceae bacterium]|nr:phytanoyl-CoA dioxygenase family protein [Isosphaeraceae bacterium]